jgi:hypothetical protein
MRCGRLHPAFDETPIALHQVMAALRASLS